MVLGASRRSDSGGSAAGDHPKRAGDLDALLNERPVFRVKLNGYDRLEVDNYAAWAEAELAGLRRQADHLLARYGACSAELEISRRLLADASRGREVYPVTARVEEMLRLAAEEAVAMTEAGAGEAERIVAEARAEADARLRKAHEIKEMAVRSADEILEQGRRDRTAAAAELERAREQAAEILREAAAERDRVAAEAEDVRRQRDDAREALLRLGDRIGDALHAIVGQLPGPAPAEDADTTAQVRTQPPVPDGRVRTVMVDNIVADPPPADDAHDDAHDDAREDAVMAGASAGRPQVDRVPS